MLMPVQQLSRCRSTISGGRAACMRCYQIPTGRIRSLLLGQRLGMPSGKHSAFHKVFRRHLDISIPDVKGLFTFEKLDN